MTEPGLDRVRPVEMPEVAGAVDQAQQTGCSSIAYTYTEPTIFYELAYDTGKLASEAGLKNVFVSNGYINIEALETIEPYLDGINVDLKAFSEKFYRERCNGHLQPVLDAMKWIAKSSIWLEVTTLVVPGQNDDPGELKELAHFIAHELGTGVPWHISRYRPDYKYDQSPPTPVATIEKTLQFGKDAGLKYCYAGNIMGHDSESTYCPECGKQVIIRSGLTIRSNKIKDGKCPDCSCEIPGVDMG